jgi:hypothetical protein
MKLTKEQLVDLLCTATYSSGWLGIKTPISERNLDKIYDEEYLENRCLEERWADRLLNGGHIVCVDYYDEDDNGDPMRYTLCLKDIEDKIEQATKDEEVVREYANWMSGDYDYYDCNNLMQYVIFGEVVYG